MRDRKEFSVGQRKDRMWNTTSCPELVEFSECAVDECANGFGMAYRSDPADRLSGVFTYELR